MFRHVRRITHAEIDRAVREYLAHGGIILRLEPEPLPMEHSDDEPYDADYRHVYSAWLARQWAPSFDQWWG